MVIVISLFTCTLQILPDDKLSERVIKRIPHPPKKQKKTGPSWELNSRPSECLSDALTTVHIMYLSGKELDFTYMYSA